MAEESLSFEYTPTWIVAAVCSIIVLISLFAERSLHRLGKCLMHNNQNALFEALQKLKEGKAADIMVLLLQLMLLGFISLLLTVFQGAISRICIPAHLAFHMLPCKRKAVSSYGSNPEHNSIKNGRRFLLADSGLNHCLPETQVPLLSQEALHQLHIFIFVLAVVHVIFCCTTMVLGGARIRQWKYWENSIISEISKSENASIHAHHHRTFFKERAVGYWRKTAVVSWMVSFFKQFYGSITKSDYIALRQGFIMAHCPRNPHFNFHKYMVRTLTIDFKKVVGISWYLWLFVVIFLLLNVEGWHTYFWLSFLPLILLVLVGAKLEHIITRLAEEVGERKVDEEHEAAGVKPSDEHFWFGRPRLILYLIHFILFQNSFEIAFFFWIWSTYGFHSCIMEKVGYIVPRLIMGVVVQVLCSYSTLPLYAIVTQMGSMFKPGIFDEHMQEYLRDWARQTKARSNVQALAIESFQDVHFAEPPADVTPGTTIIHDA